MDFVKRAAVVSLVFLFAFGAVLGCGEEPDLEELEEQLEEPMEPVPADPDED